MTQKIKVSPDTLYQYLIEHNFTFSMLSKYMGVSNGNVYNSFQHVLNRHGKPMKLSSVNLERLNAVLPQIADDLRVVLTTLQHVSPCSISPGSSKSHPCSCVYLGGRKVSAI